MELELTAFVGQGLDNMILNSLNLKISILLFIIYSYISFFGKWNLYVMYVFDTNNMNLF